MEVSSDSQIDTDLPESPSDASGSNIASPPDEVSALEHELPERLFAHSQDDGADRLPSQLVETQPQTKERGNGRVYEISQDGKLKLKISLKGLRNPLAERGAGMEAEEGVEDDEIEEDDDEEEGDADDTHTLVLASQDKEDTQETAKIVSQDAVPPSVAAAEATSQPRAGDGAMENQSIAQRLNSAAKNDLDDTFSDDISMSEIEKGVVVASPSSNGTGGATGGFVELSPSVEILRTPQTYTVRLKLSTRLIDRLKQDRLSPVAKKGQARVSKRLQAKAKAIKPRTKMKKRPKPQYSRYMVKMPQFVPVVPQLPSLPQNPPMDLATLIKMQLANQTHPDVGSVGMGGDDDDDDDIVEKYVRLSLKDPLSGSRMVTPLRSRYCSHVECFDYESFLAMYNLRPFRIAIQRYTDKPAKVGEVDVMRILEDTKRKVLDVKDHNKMTPSFPYKTKQKMFKEKNKQMNDLEWFCCPICKLEFNIKRVGDVYVVGEFVDMLQDLSLEENNETVEDIEIDMSEKGKWRWIREDENDALLSHAATSGANGTNGHGPAPADTTQSTTHDATSTDGSQVANTSIPRETRHNVEVVTLDSEDEDEAENATTPIVQPTASQSIVNALGPIIHADNPDTTEEEMMKQIDALFESEIMNADDTDEDAAAAAAANDTPASTPTAPTKNPSPLRAVEVVPVSSTPPPLRAPVAPQPRFAGSASSLFQKAVDNYRPYSGSIAGSNGGAFIKDPNPHRGVVVFRPGAFTTLNYEEPVPAPVFMSGEGAADDPIVLD